MKQSLLIARRELYAYIRSPLGAIIIAGALLLDALLLYWSGLSAGKPSAEVLQLFFYNTSGVTMAAALFLSMRLLAEERQTGTMTLLNTAPVRDSEIVAGKFLAAFGMITVMTALTFYMPLLIYVTGKVSVGHILVGYVGLLFLGAAATAISLFASSLARSTVVAVIVGAALLAVIILQWAVARAVDPPLNKFLAAIALHHENFRPFMNGILQLSGIAYYVAITYFFLLCATKVLEARRWR
jgi:ABC-2 type transport system permease protein